VSDNEVLVMFVTLEGEEPGRNISDRHKIEQSWRAGKKSKGRNRKYSISV